MSLNPKILVPPPKINFRINFKKYLTMLRYMLADLKIAMATKEVLNLFNSIVQCFQHKARTVKNI
jgi:hypothetical protein